MGVAPRAVVGTPMGDITVTTSGNGRPVLLLADPGTPADKFDQGGFRDSLTSEFTVITPEFPGGTVGRETVGDYAAAAADIIATAGLGPAGVFGHHAGATIAAELVRRRPDSVRALVLSGLALAAPNGLDPLPALESAAGPVIVLAALSDPHMPDVEHIAAAVKHCEEAIVADGDLLGLLAVDALLPVVRDAFHRR